jgi:hypothetical protein
VEVGDVLRLAPGRQAPPRNLDDYELVALETKAKNYRHSSKTATGLAEVSGVNFNYKGMGTKPYLDKSFAVGLVYRGTLSAVAAAGIKQDRHLSIAQLQSVAPPANPDKGVGKYDSGLHGGFLWRDTLVQAWTEIARKLGVSVLEVQGAVNNRWLGDEDDSDDYVEWYERFIKGYDEVAERMGFTQNDDKNWELDISPAEFTLSEVALAGNIGGIVRE